MIKILFLVGLLTSGSLAQTDWEYWKAAEPSYVSYNHQNSTREDGDNITNKLISGAKSVYSFFISDLDGDNCPFKPTCSEFFVQSAHRTNLLKSILMFSDRFTRDMNLGKGRSQYLLSEDGHFLDQVDNYILDQSSIHNIPLKTE